MSTNIPMSNVIFVHKFHALYRSASEPRQSKVYQSYLTYLRKKRNKFPESLKRWVTIVSQQGMDHDWLFTGQLDNVEQACAIISWIRGKGLGGEKSIDLEFIRPFLEQEPFQYHRPPVRDSGCVDT